jgi:hypothetical protein
MANADEGRLLHHCGKYAAVRKNKNGKLYLMCPHCGQLPYNLPGGQEYILENAEMYGPDGLPPAKPEPSQEPETTTDDIEIVNVTQDEREPEPEPVTLRNEPEPVTSGNENEDEEEEGGEVLMPWQM